MAHTIYYTLANGNINMKTTESSREKNIYIARWQNFNWHALISFHKLLEAHHHLEAQET